MGPLAGIAIDRLRHRGFGATLSEDHRGELVVSVSHTGTCYWYVTPPWPET